MQSRLPDINTAFNTHRKRAIIAIERKDWLEAIGSLYSINAALELNFRVIISDQEYKKLTRQDIIITCKNCKEQIDYSAVKILTVVERAMNNFVGGTKHSKVWFCIKCNHENPLNTTPMEQSVLKQPYYLGVIAKPPARTDGLLSHVMYDRQMKRWCLTMLAELEAKMAEYRDANWKRSDEDEFGDYMVDTTLEENDTTQ